MTEELLSKIYNNGIDINNFILLKMVAEEIKIPNHIKILGILNLFEKKGWTENKKITTKGFELLANIDATSPIISKKLVEVKKTSISFNAYCNSLFEKIIDLINRLTGKTTGQFRNPSGKSLRPSNVKELKEQLEKFIKKYNIKDLEGIEKAILEHVRKCISSPTKYQRTIYYFIDKANFPSELLDALENEEEIIKETFYEVKNTKNLF